jgi:PAS domain S-box-containing protein
LRDEQGQVTGVVAISEDITDRVRAERERRAGEVVLQAVFDAIPHFVFVKDREGRYIKVNRALDQIVEGGPSVIGQRAVIEEGRPADELEQTHAADRRVLAGERVTEIGRITRPDGSVRELNKIKVPLREPDGRVVGIVGVSEDITDRLQSERKLRESQALLQAVFDAIPYTVYAKDTASKFIAVNKATELQWQQPAAVLLTQRFGNDPLRPESERAQILRQDRRVLETGERFEEPVRFNVPGKGPREFRNIKVPMRDGDGRIIGLVGVSEDITERVTAERELRESRTLLQSILDTLPETIYVKDRDFRYTMVNSVMCSRLNLDRQDLLGKTADDLRSMSPATLPKIHDADRYVLETGEVVELPDMRFEFPDGRVMYERQLKAPLRDGAGEIVGIVGMAEDTTARVQADEALKSNQRMLRTILDTLPEGVFVKDLAGRYQLVNKHHAELYGLQPGDFLGLRTAELKTHINPDRLALVADSDRSVIETGKAVEVPELLYIDSAGEEAWERVIKVPLRDEHGQIAGIVGLREDITSRKKAEVERLALERLMQRTQNLESLGAMAGGIAHDFNNLLQRILGYAELALLEVEAGSAAAVSVQMIQDAGMSAAGLTKQMLTLSGRSRFALEPVDLDALAESSAMELRRTLAPGIELAFTRGTDAPRIMGDSALLRQVLHSLVSNGEEALAGKPGRIALTTGGVTLSRDRLDESFSDREVAPGPYGYLDVSDSGPGIPDDVRTRLFEPFMSTKFMGRGLGLAAVRGIVRGHRGTIQVRSTAGSGTTFRILLPASDGRETLPGSGFKSGT